MLGRRNPLIARRWTGPRCRKEWKHLSAHRSVADARTTLVPPAMPESADTVTLTSWQTFGGEPLNYASGGS
jgi:hypothetical protein